MPLLLLFTWPSDVAADEEYLGVLTAAEELEFAVTKPLLNIGFPASWPTLIGAVMSIKGGFG
jgi:hypothetical protein